MALTAPQLALLRSKNQWSKRYLIVRKPNTILTATLASVPGTTDMIASITYTLVSGTYTNVIPGMTLMVGTTSGARDLGIARIRKTPTNTILYIGEQSAIHWSGGCYLTVTDNYMPWAKPVKIIDVETVLYDMDFDVAYTDQHLNYSPVPILGPPQVVELVAGTAGVTFDASASWVFDATITGHVWTAPGSYSISGGTTATPTITYHAVGHYVVYDTVTASNGKTTIGMRYVFVWSVASPPITTFKINSYHEAYDQGGWTVAITAQGEMAIASVDPNAYAILFAKDYFASVIGTCPGEVTGRENIMMCGWIDEESITFTSDISSVDFSLQGLTYWLKKLPSFPLYVENSVAAATAWSNMEGLTVDRMLYDCLYWRSTLIAIADCYLTGDTKLATFFKEQIGSFYDQLKAVSYATIYADIGSDKYGRLYVAVEPQLIPFGSRGSIPTLQVLDPQDWHDEAAFRNVVSNTTSMIALGGVVTYADNTALPFQSDAPGTVMDHYGNVESADSLLIASQAQANELAGLLLAWKNNPYPQMVLKMSGNYRVYDCWPLRRIQLVTDESDTLRDIDFSGYLLIRGISGTENEFGFMDYEVTFETFTAHSDDGITVPVPDVPAPELPPDPGLPVYPPFPGWPYPVGSLTRTYTWVVKYPGIGGIIGPRLKEGHLVVRIDAVCVLGTSVTFNVECRPVPGTPGTDVMTADAVAVVSPGVSVTSFAAPMLAPDSWLWLDISGSSGAVAYLAVTVVTRV